MALPSELRPLGIFDSGVGGLTVVREILKVLPEEDIIYFGDTARLPYGEKSKETVIRFSKNIVDFLLKRKIKMLIVACHTASSLSLDSLKRKYPIPIRGIVRPGARVAAKITRNRRVGVIATRATVKSEMYEKELRRIDERIKVFTIACPLFVPLVEEGWVNHKVTREVSRFYLTPLKKKTIDTLVLGSTHYPLLGPVIQRAVGVKVKLVDAAEALAREVKASLEKASLKNPGPGPGKISYLVTDEPERFSAQGGKFLGRKIKPVKLVKEL